MSTVQSRILGQLYMVIAVTNRRFAKHIHAISRYVQNRSANLLTSLDCVMIEMRFQRSVFDHNVLLAQFTIDGRHCGLSSVIENDLQLSEELSR